MDRSDLNIPESLEKWYLDHGWFDDYWKEIPINWRELPNEVMKIYPILQEILNWRKNGGGQNGSKTGHELHR